MPQNAAGRITEPAVCVPKASGAMRSATAAAEPLDEPPGVCVRVARVGGLARRETGEFGRDRLAEHDRPGGARQRDAGGVGRGTMARIDRRAVPGRHVGGVDQVLDRDRDAVQRPARGRRVAAPRRGERRLGIEILPGADHRLARGDPFEACGDQRLGAEPAFGDLVARPRGRRGTEDRASDAPGWLSRG